MSDKFNPMFGSNVQFNPNVNPVASNESQTSHGNYRIPTGNPASQFPTGQYPPVNVPNQPPATKFISVFDGASVKNEEVTENDLSTPPTNLKKKTQLPDYMKMIIQPGDNYLRLVGKYKKIKVHWVIGDDGVSRPYRCDILCTICELINPFLSYILVDTVSSTGKKTYRRKYNYEDIAPALSKKITGDASLGIQGWIPKERFLFNCIDRMDDLCHQTHHTKILSYSERSIGIGAGTAEQIWALAQEYGPYNRYDIKITRSGTGRGTSYTVMPRHNGMFDLTEEEKNYTLYDLEKITETITPPHHILEDAPHQVREILTFLSQQNVINTSAILIEMAKQFNVPISSTKIYIEKNPLEPTAPIPPNIPNIPIQPNPSAQFYQQQNNPVSFNPRNAGEVEPSVIKSSKGIVDPMQKPQASMPSAQQGSNMPPMNFVTPTPIPSPAQSKLNFENNEGDVCPHCGTPREGNELQCSYCGAIFK